MWSSTYVEPQLNLNMGTSFTSKHNNPGKKKATMSNTIEVGDPASHTDLDDEWLLPNPFMIFPSQLMSYKPCSNSIIKNSQSIRTEIQTN
jgi:hypothetical protein